MRIKKLQLKNGYKRFFNLTIDLGDTPKRVVALVGPNGCGKSSVLDGILFHANAHAQIGNKGNKDYQYHSMNRTPNYNYSNITIEFDKGTFQEIRQQKVESGKENTIFSFRSPYRYNSTLNVTESKATTEIRLNNYGATTASDLDDKMEENYRRLYVKYDKYLNDQDCPPSQAKAKIIGDLNSSIKECLDLEISSIGNIEASKGTLYFKKLDHPNEFEFNVLSSGEKEVVDILLDLYLRQDEYTDTIFLLDEPELHINTNVQKNLLIEIDKLVGKDCQIWLTTHSIGFLRTLQDKFREECQVIQFKSYCKFASESYLLTPMTMSRSNWKDIFEIALDDIVNLISPKRIIYCEGRDRPGNSGIEKGLDAQIFNNVFANTYIDTLFVSSGGNTELDQRSEIAIAILGKVFSDLEILVLKDRDMASGKDTNENDRIVYLKTNPDNHRVLKRWEIENYLYDKEVLVNYCKSNQLNFDQETYDNFVSDINNQNLKDHTSQIKNICGIKNSINPEKFKLELSKYITQDMEVYSELESCVIRRE
ncbi:AAA family ATPase [Synechocystis salina LEGE 00031]|uniref:AAA family ATPase n=2 Tax=Synechocystis TaxID=1142 RepID=A0ABR9VR47_9SYNC|nr:ATP-binding protein [Synechocystis salina]MBE9253819.1 AAA family ATPase [Synechocystis salina LEGE 00031]